VLQENDPETHFAFRICDNIVEHVAGVDDFEMAVATYWRRGRAAPPECGFSVIGDLTAGETTETTGPARAQSAIRSSSLLKKVFGVSRLATLIQDPPARRTKDSQPSGFGFEYWASHVRF
jgi:hypothetical protein